MNRLDKVLLKIKVRDRDLNYNGYIIKKLPSGYGYGIYKDGKFVSSADSEREAQKDIDDIENNVHDTEAGFSYKMHLYNDAVAKGDLENAKTLLTSAASELLNYTNKANRRKDKKELNNKLRTFGMDPIDRAIETIKDSLESDKAKALSDYKEAKEKYLKKAEEVGIREAMKSKEWIDFTNKEKACMLLGCRI